LREFVTNEAIILAGGFGTRLQSVVNDVPKPMAPVNGQPFLNYQLRYLKFYGIKKVVLSVGHLHEKITSYYKNNFEDLEIDYTIEKEALGTGGGIRLAMEKCNSESILVLNGDSFFEINLNSFSDKHLKANSDYSLALRKVMNAARYGTIQMGTDVRISSFKEKDGKETPGLINAGIYLLNKEIYLSNTEANKSFSIEKDFFEKKLNELTISGFEFDGYFIDIGIPEDYSKAQYDFKGSKYR
jgi:D-glycero-alpha-D-manno-heptose 1-phosphate guanylyltransferase